MGALGDIGHFIMTPLYYAISAVLIGWHHVFSLVLPAEGGMSWALSIIGLTLVIRAALIPLFVKQIKSQRNMQLIQPKVKELQKKYGHDRAKLGEETMKLYKDAGTNPFASCLPLLVQMPIFFALFRLIDHAAKSGTGNGFLSDTAAKQFADSQIFGVLPISSSFTNPDPTDLHPSFVMVRIVAAVLVLVMTATTFTTQRQLMSKNMPADAMSGQYAQQQKMLLYILPLVFGIGGIAFPIGVLFYWTTSNLWTMGQQFYVIRNNPAPGTPAFKAKQDRDRTKRTAHGLPEPTEPDVAVAPSVVQEVRPAVRAQPKRQTKAQRQAAARQASARQSGNQSNGQSGNQSKSTGPSGSGAQQTPKKTIPAKPSAQGATSGSPKNRNKNKQRGSK